MIRIARLLFVAISWTACAPANAQPASADAWSTIDAYIAARPMQSGAYVLEQAEEALLARAWLADHAQRSIEVQYFIWSTDNIGILAAESVLRAAKRGVQVRIVVDDILVDAPDDSLLALARHPNIDIRIYNPTLSVGVTLHKKALNAASDFRGVNQRMHDKTFIVDGKVAITGGRNMSSEYCDFHQAYNFRDRDVLLIGDVVKSMGVNFENFWAHELAVPVENLFGGLGLLKKNVRIDEIEVERIYRDLHAYAQASENFAPEVRAAIAAVPETFDRIARQTVWGRIEFISDRPGKNNDRVGLGGGGLTTDALAKLVAEAKSSLVIQSPYLVLSDEAIDLFRGALKRGVRIRINTNSLASTDNLPAFGGYQSQRRRLLKMGIEIFEYRPDAKSQREARQRTLVGRLPVAAAAPSAAPIFGLHAKTLIVDNRIAFIGTYNLDPRSQNLNTEVGAVIYNEEVARQVVAAIEVDMDPDNSWNAATDDPDGQVPFLKRAKARAWRLLPIKPLL
jgi:cardiolipin synthase C